MYAELLRPKDRTITEIPKEQYFKRLNESEKSAVQAIVDIFSQFPLETGEKMWVIGVGGVANQKPDTKDVDISVHLQSNGPERITDEDTGYALYLKYLAFVQESLRKQPGLTFRTERQRFSESQIDHPFIFVSPLNGRDVHIATQSSCVYDIEYDENNNAHYVVRSDIVDLSKTDHYGKHDVPDHSHLWGTRFCVLLDRTD